jgi:large subunit ribosomal protein L13
MKAIGTKTFSATASQAQAGQRWYVIDAEGQVLGRVATTVAQLLRGKGKPTFTPHMDCGDFVVVVNASKIALGGSKRTDKVYHRHSGRPGSLKSVPAGELLAKDPRQVVELAVWGMLPKNRLSRKLIKKLKVYAGPEHPHAAQQPKAYQITQIAQ